MQSLVVLFVLSDKQSYHMICTRRGKRAVKMRTALLEIHTVPQKQCETILLLPCVFLKMSENKYSDSEFYYPGELSDKKIKKNAHMIKCSLTEWG